MMNKDDIVEIGIDAIDRLYVKPRTRKFPYIYREAMEVGWDSERGVLFSPKPREWSYLDWFRQIRSAAKEQGFILEISTLTKWRNVPQATRREIEAAQE